MNRESRTSSRGYCCLRGLSFFLGLMASMQKYMNLHTGGAFAQRRGACADLVSLHRESHDCQSKWATQNPPTSQRKATENSTQKVWKGRSCRQLLARSPMIKKSSRIQVAEHGALAVKPAGEKCARAHDADRTSCSLLNCGQHQRTSQRCLKCIV